MRTTLSLSMLALLAAGAVHAQMPIVVTSTEDSGEGSLRAALAEAAEARGGARIVVAAEGDIAIESGLDYAGQMPIEIVGTGQTVTAAGDMTLFTASQGANLTITDLNFAGPGGFSIENQSEMGGGKGIFVDIREDQEGQFHLVLDRVGVSGVSGHGIHVSDCSLADDCGAGAGGGGEGSAASIVASLTDVTVEDAGNGAFDRDGVRLDERGEGDIYVTIRNSTFTGVGADGVEFDEGNAGNVIVTSYGSTYSDNGGYCDPEILEPLMPEEPEGEFEQGQMQEADIPGEITGSPDDACFEREVSTYDDGSVEEYEIGIDLDDGFDIDEADEGVLDILVVGGEVNNNLDEGMDMDEAGDGDLTGSYVNVQASGNTDDAYKHSEEDAGSVMGVVIGSSATDNGGVGFVYEEEGEGDAMVQVMDATTSGNDDGETAFEVVQEDDGMGELSITGGDLGEEIEAEGVEVMQN